jgi:hypothetical protein
MHPFATTIPEQAIHLGTAAGVVETLPSRGRLVAVACRDAEGEGALPMHTQPLDRVPLWVQFVIGCALLWAGLEGGYRLGKWRHARTAEEKEAPVGAMVGTLLGLLALVRTNRSMSAGDWVQNGCSVGHTQPVRLKCD